MIMSYDPGDPAYWRRFAETARQMHAEHLASARMARRWGRTAEASRFLTLAAVDRNCLVIALETERRMTGRRTAFAGEVSP